MASPEWSPNIYSQICNTAPCLYNISRPLGWSGGHTLYLFLTTLSFFIIHIILILFFINPHYSYPSLSTLGHTVLRGHNNLTFCDVVILVPVLSKKKHTFKMFSYPKPSMGILPFKDQCAVLETESFGRR